MSHLFSRLPFSVPNASLPVIPPSDIEPLTHYESGADDHWVFGGSAESLTGHVTGRQLSASGGAPAFFGSYLTIPGGTGQGLESGVTESSAQSDTICAVLRLVPGGATQGLFGGISDSTVNVGGAPFVSSASPNIYITYRGTTISSLNSQKTLPSGQWFFLALSRDFSSGVKIARMALGGDAPVTLTGSGEYRHLQSPRSLSLGNPYFGANNASLDCAEFVMLPRAMGEDELIALYYRRRAFMATRGIAI